MTDVGHVSSSDGRAGLVTGFAVLLLGVSVLSAYGALQTFATQSARVDQSGSADNPLFLAAAVSLGMSMLCAYGAVGFLGTLGGRFRKAVAPGLFAVTLVFLLLAIASYGMWSAPPTCPGGCA